MLQEAKKLFLAGVGAAAMTYDKSLEVVEQLVARGKLTVEEGKELSEELKRDVKEKAEAAKSKANDKFQEMKPLTKEDMTEVLQSLDFATKSEVEDLKSRIKTLEEIIAKNK